MDYFTKNNFSFHPHKFLGLNFLKFKSRLLYVEGIIRNFNIIKLSSLGYKGIHISAAPNINTRGQIIGEVASYLQGLGKLFTKANKNFKYIRISHNKALGLEGIFGVVTSKIYYLYSGAEPWFLKGNLDHDNYLCSLLLPQKLRATAFAVRAFNIELSKIQEQTNEQHMGIMRVKFWEDSLDKVFRDKPPNHPVLQEIYKATKRHKLSKMYLKRLLTSRLNQLNVSTFKDITEMENYADQTCTPVLMLLLEAFNVRNIDCDHAASHIGRAQGLTNLIRSLPYNLKEKVVLLPRTELLKHNISEESLMRNLVNSDILSQIIFEVASKANNHLKVADLLKEKIPVECKSLFLPAVPIRVYLNKLEKSNFHIYDPNLNSKNGLLPMYLYWSKIRKTY